MDNEIFQAGYDAYNNNLSRNEIPGWCLWAGDDWQRGWDKAHQDGRPLRDAVVGIFEESLKPLTEDDLPEDWK